MEFEQAPRAGVDREVAAGPPIDLGRGGDGGSGGGDPLVTTLLSDETIFARSDLMAHWALDGLEREIGGLGGDDPPRALAKLHQVADKAKREAEGKVDADEAVIAHRAADAKTQLPLLVDPMVVPEGPSVVPPPPDRALMREQIQDAGKKELTELDAGFAVQKAELERRMADQLGAVDTEQKAQTGNIEAHIATGDATAGKDIAGRSAVHATQIGGERALLDAQAAEEHEPLAQKAAKDADGVKGQAAAQARETHEHAKQKAQATVAEGRAQANQARLVGETKARDALLAAQRLANQLRARLAYGESNSVTEDGEERARTARAEGEKQADAIEARADALAKQIVADGERRAQAQIARGETAAAEAKARGQAGAGRVTMQANIAHTAMQMQAAAAAERMSVERRGLAGESRAQLDASTRAMTADTAPARALAEKEKAATLARMEKTHEEERKKVEARVKATLAKVDLAKDKDLAGVQRQVNADLKALDRSSTDADAAMAKQVKRAEEKLKREVDVVKRRLRAEAHKAMAAIDRFVVAAKKRILAADKNTKADIAAAAKSGREAIDNVSTDAFIDLAAGDREAEGKLKLAAERDRGELDKKAAGAAGDLKSQVANVGASIDAQWVDAAVKTANGELDDEGVLNIVTDGEAVRAMNVLAGLPASVQGQAVARLDDAQFENLLDEVPTARREELGPLVKSTTHPERKLRLWREFYKSQAQNDVERHKGDIGQDTALWNITAEQNENERRHKRRRAAADQSENEADEEASFLIERAKKGTAFTAGDVEKLMERKAIEHNIEMKYNLNITNEAGARKDASKIVWTADELKMLEASFGQIPIEHMAGNKLLKELRREDVLVEKDAEKPTVGGQHGGGVVTVFDGGARTTGSSGYRHGGDARELASPYICGRCGTKITVLDMVVTHEIGHDIHDQNDDAFDAYKKESGWESHDKGDLKDAGLSTAEIDKLEATRKKNYSERDTIRKNGKIYMIDPYGGGYLAVDETAIPEKGESEVGAGGGDDDTWGYARSNFKDHFAEHYAKAVHVPQKLYKDLVESPRHAVGDKQAAVKRSEDALKALVATRNTPEQYELAQKALSKAQRELATAEKAQTQRQKQFEVMRNQVFGTNRAVQAAYMRLMTKGVAGDKVATFLKDAAKVSTPDQVKLLEDGVK